MNNKKYLPHDTALKIPVPSYQEYVLKIVIMLVTFLLIGLNDIIAQYPLKRLVPQPRQSYVREEYSTVFSFSENNQIYLNPEKPALRQAMEFNRGLIKRGIDTLEYNFLDDNDTLVGGVVLGFDDERINRLFEFIPDQNIEVNNMYPGVEGYALDVLPVQVIIAGSDERGLHYGINTFFQMFDLSPTANMVFASRVLDAPEFPVRWVYYTTNYLVGENINKLKPVWEEASDLKLNGILNSDYKWGFLSDMPKRYFDSLISARDFSKEKYMDLVAGIFSFGYSGNILYHNPNWASGLLVQGQKFFIESDTGRLIPSVDVSLSNGGLEDYNENNFSGFSFIDDPGVKSFVDTDNKHSGKASIKFTDFDNPQSQSPNARLSKRVKVKPFTLYHMSAWLKTENLTSGYITQMTAIGKNGQSLNYAYINVPQTTDWKKVDITFNSLDNDTINIYWGTWNAKTGTIWWDDLVFEEVAFVNMLRRPGTPINVSHTILDIAYREGVDYDSLYDAKLGRVYGYGGNYDSWHQLPTFKIKSGGAIQNGDTILISYYHTAVIHDGQVMITMSDPDVYTTIEKEFQILDSILKPKTYFMNHDEIRLMNRDYGDQLRGLTPGEILADNVGKCKDIIKKYNPDADIWLWSDMFDEYHNAKPSGYYLVNGDLTGSADIISDEIGIANWNSGKHEQSLDFFAEKGFRQMSAPYYDQDENNIRGWKEWTQNTPDFYGMIYTTWQKKYTHLEPFAEYSWNHAPYIYHYPIKSSPRGKLMFPVIISGDEWDKSWTLNGSSLYYRTNINDEFTRQEFQAVPDEQTIVSVTLTQENKFLQYYFEATDNHNWTTKIPFGENKYFELGETSTDIYDRDKLNFSIYPNPVTDNKIINIKFDSKFNDIKEISIVDVFGNNLLDETEESANTASLDLNNLSSGMYFVRIIIKNDILTRKIIVY
jgi:hypothetical protein